MLAGMVRPELAGLALVGLALACTPLAKPLAEPEPDGRVARLCGTWRAEGPEGSVIEERWRVSREGLVGEGTVVDGQGTPISHESLWLVLPPGSSTYRAHPQGATEPTNFEQTEDRAEAATGRWIWIWSNPTHDFPQTIRYESLDESHFVARISGANSDGFAWTFERVAPCS